MLIDIRILICLLLVVVATFNKSYASLVGHWTFDEDADSAVAFDSAGEADGVISTGIKAGVEGVYGTAYEFNGSGYVDMGNAELLSTISGASFSISYWIKVGDNGTGRNVAVFLGNDRVSDRYIDTGIENNDLIYGRDRGAGSYPEVKSSKVYNDSQWHHIVFAINANDGHSLYVDSELIVSDTAVLDLTEGINNLEIGRLGRSSPTDYFRGVIDDVRIYDEALTAEQVMEMFYSDKARNPNPANGEIDVAVNQTLSWKSGDGNFDHNIYLGTDPDDLVMISAVFQGTESLEIEEMVHGIDYFWRIDEVENGQLVSIGSVWTFRTFEPYCPSRPIGDIAGNDCVVDIRDFVFMASEWLECGLEPFTACE